MFKKKLIEKFKYVLFPKIKFLKEIGLASISSNNWQSLNPCDILLVCHDNNRGYIYQGQAYAPLLDSLGDL